MTTTTKKAISERPMHTHLCEEDPPHQWSCDSPYCLEIPLACTVHGGEKPKDFRVRFLKEGAKSNAAN